MKRRLITVVGAAAVVGIAAVVAVCEAPRPAKGLVGKEAPDFTLNDLHGKSYSLKDYRGKIVVLEWANKDCPIWRGKLKVLSDTYKRYVDRGVVWLNIDSTYSMQVDPNLAFMVKNDVTKPVLVDRDGKVGRAYDARTTPHMFLIDRQGKILYDGAIDNQGNDKGYVNYVAKALDEVLAGKPVSQSVTNPYGCSVKYKK